LLNFAGSHPVLAASKDVVGGVVAGVIVGAFLLLIVVLMISEAETKFWPIFWIAFIALGIWAYFSV